MGPSQGKATFFGPVTPEISPLKPVAEKNVFPFTYDV